MPLKGLKIILAKIGLDGHDRGVMMVSQWLRDAGFEVIYLGGHQTPEKVVNAIIQEDAKILGLSFSGGDHLFHTKKMLEKMKEKGLDNIPLLVGGVFPNQDISTLRQMGASEVFVAGSSLHNVVKYLEELSNKSLDVDAPKE